jgi:hypothetical protein
MAPDIAPLTGPSAERHYSPIEISELWGMNATFIRRLFAHEPGVLRFGSRKSGTRRYFSLRIPESTMRRVHRRLSQLEGE